MNTRTAALTLTLAGVLAAAAPSATAATTTSATTPATVAATTAPISCREAAAQAQSLLGQPWEDDLITYPLMRVIPHDAITTLDFIPERLTVLLDADRRITRIFCG
ncbi:I78 family peptidase inhibitor [Actinomadura kijaniata]|uniref:I78 family peptidase inhibitor n=1 Tax=Actinomadura kijaniata TaxID=46161 RepID=UPI003F1B08C5